MKWDIIILLHKVSLLWNTKNHRILSPIVMNDAASQNSDHVVYFISLLSYETFTHVIYMRDLRVEGHR